MNDPGGHSYGHSLTPPPLQPDDLARLPTEPAFRRRALAVLFADDPPWLHAIDLFNEGYPWEAHEAWEQFWHALGRTTSEARFVQGLIHLAAAAVKIREGRPVGVARHTQRARELLGGAGAAGVGGEGGSQGFVAPTGALGPDPASLGAVMAELEAHQPECWRTSWFPVVKVRAAGLRVVGWRGCKPSRKGDWAALNPGCRPSVQVAAASIGPYWQVYSQMSEQE